MSVLTAAEQVRAREVLRLLGTHPRVTTEDGTVLELLASVAKALGQPGRSALPVVDRAWQTETSPHELSNGFTRPSAAISGDASGRIVQVGGDRWSCGHAQPDALVAS